MPAPIGVGVFCRAHSQMEPPERAAVRAEQAGLRHVALMACWQEHSGSTIRNRVDLARYAEAFHVHGIRVRLWGYPWHGFEREFSDALRLHLSLAKGLISGVIVNPELGYRGQPGAAEVLMRRVVDVLGEGMDLWVSSYGHPQNIRDFPWEVFSRWGHGSGQPYFDDVAAELEVGLRGWKALWKEPGQLLVPGIPLFGELDEAQLAPWLEMLLRVYLRVVGAPLPGVIGWSWPQMSPGEAHTLRWLASKLDELHELAPPP